MAAFAVGWPGVFVLTTAFPPSIASCALLQWGASSKSGTLPGAVQADRSTRHRGARRECSVVRTPGVAHGVGGGGRVGGARECHQGGDGGRDDGRGDGGYLAWGASCCRCWWSRFPTSRALQWRSWWRSCMGSRGVPLPVSSGCPSHRGGGGRGEQNPGLGSVRHRQCPHLERPRRPMSRVLVTRGTARGRPAAPVPGLLRAAGRRNDRLDFVR